MSTKQVSVEVSDEGTVRRVFNPSQKFIKDWERCENKVHLKLAYVRYIASVDTVAQTFQVAIGFDMSWKSSPADERSWASNPAKFVPEFVPNFEFPNAKEEIKERREQENGNPFKIDVIDGVSYNFLRTLVYLKCMERYELYSFPFDVQELTVTMDTSFVPVQKSMFVPHLGSLYIDEEAAETNDAGPIQDGDPQGGTLLILNRAFCAIPEFRARRVVLEFASRSGGGGDEDNEDAFRWSQVVIRFQLERRAEGFLWRIAFLSVLLAVTALSSFALEVDQLAERQSLLITLILASVAFQYVVQSELPQVPYVVLLEKLTLATFTSNVVLMCLVSLLSTNLITEDQDMRERIDFYFAITYVIWLGGSVVAFFLYGMYRRRFERTKLNMGALGLKEYNNDEREDSAIVVSGDGVCKESLDRSPDGLDGFITFAGKALE
ncbi:Hypothetical Protein FCC1311_052892 [Hondaea fermentalgiana]|uniref:Neurotransmitter-gated ion-channel ligand-binding domain-containing protein n=1 Tax=Hondaea fermentalgiana TaxID=2315210 RepID=A0A2R5GDP1_9STRA|nr:Hypothetical Protein FCC1311_052892 [Hondaea fermentalgiana]|eukprot:GBG29067.1 Hypothetical Protein FCC1311_052892 [Hondaea fermentalgiana]